MRKPVFGVSDHIQHKSGCATTDTARGLKFRIYAVEGLYYLCSEKKGMIYALLLQFMTWCTMWILYYTWPMITANSIWKSFAEIWVMRGKQQLSLLTFQSRFPDAGSSLCR